MLQLIQALKMCPINRASHWRIKESRRHNNWPCILTTFIFFLNSLDFYLWPYHKTLVYKTSTALVIDFMARISAAAACVWETLAKFQLAVENTIAAVQFHRYHARKKITSYVKYAFILQKDLKNKKEIKKMLQLITRAQTVPIIRDACFTSALHAELQRHYNCTSTLALANPLLKPPIFSPLAIPEISCFLDICPIVHGPHAQIAEAVARDQESPSEFKLVRDCQCEA